jgi:hypothetical protein
MLFLDELPAFSHDVLAVLRQRSSMGSQGDTLAHVADLAAFAVLASAALSQRVSRSIGPWGRVG